MDELEFRNSSLSFGDVAKMAAIGIAAYAAVSFGGLVAVGLVAGLTLGCLARSVLKH